MLGGDTLATDTVELQSKFNLINDDALELQYEVCSLLKWPLALLAKVLQFIYP